MDHLTLANAEPRRCRGHEPRLAQWEECRDRLDQAMPDEGCSVELLRLLLRTKLEIREREPSQLHVRFVTDSRPYASDRSPTVPIGTASRDEHAFPAAIQAYSAASYRRPGVPALKVSPLRPDKSRMRKQLATVALLSVLLFTGVGSATFLSRALASANSSAAIRRADHIGPKPTPRWYWRWAVWRLGEGYAKGHAVQRSLRPRRAPRRVPEWAWRRLHAFLMLRRLAAGTNGQHGSHTPTTPSTTTPTTTPSTTTSTTPTAPGWTTVVNDQFNSGGLPSHWIADQSPYGSAPHNCTSPTHDYVSGGYLHLVESYEQSRPAGVTCPYSAGWYTGGLKLDPVAPYAGNDQQVTLRYRIVSTGGVVSHHIIPMRWPTGITYKYQMNNGEEDFPETDTLTSARTFLHYVTSGGGQQIYSPPYNIDLTQWHTFRFTQLNHTIYAYIDDMNTPVWTFTGNATTIPDVLRTTVLQQECSHTNGCPSGTTGSEDIQIDWITVDNAS